MDTPSESIFNIDKLLRTLSVLCFVSLLIGWPIEQAHAQFAQLAAQESHEQTTSEEEASDTQSEGGSGENQEEADASINLSDSIPLDEAIEVWEDSYSQFLASIGLDNSLYARLAASGIIIVTLFALMMVANSVTKAVRKKVTHLARRVHLSRSKTRFYQRAILWLINFFLLLGALSALTVTWNIDVDKTISGEWVANALANLLTVYFIVLGGTIIVHIADGLVEKLFRKWGSKRRSRTNTLLPIARNTVYVTCFILFTLMLLAELGINVMPLLAGAGVLGFAIGFGAQTLIKDLLMGFIIIFEDLIQVDDVVTLAGKTGIIERITIRKVQLRDLSGNVYTVPFSEVSIVENKTKDFSYAMLEIGVAYREDVDQVMDLLVQVDKDMQEHEDFSNVMLEPLEMFGLDKFGDSAIVVKARIKTVPLEQWRVLREFNRRIKILFDENNIEIPFPHQTIYFGEDKDGKAPPMRLVNHCDKTFDEASNDTSPHGAGKHYENNSTKGTQKKDSKQPAPEGDQTDSDSE